MNPTQSELKQAQRILEIYRDKLRVSDIKTVLDNMSADIAKLEEAEYNRFVEMVNKQPNVICAMWRGSRIKRVRMAYVGKKMLNITQADIDEAADI